MYNNNFASDSNIPFYRINNLNDFSSNKPQNENSSKNNNIKDKSHNFTINLKTGSDIEHNNCFY